jgi:hypothetical protein
MQLVTVVCSLARSLKIGLALINNVLIVQNEVGLCLDMAIRYHLHMEGVPNWM